MQLAPFHIINYLNILINKPNINSIIYMPNQRYSYQPLPKAAVQPNIVSQPLNNIIN